MKRAWPDGELTRFLAISATEWVLGSRHWILHPRPLVQAKPLSLITKAQQEEPLRLSAFPGSEARAARPGIWGSGESESASQQEPPVQPA